MGLSAYDLKGSQNADAGNTRDAAAAAVESDAHNPPPPRIGSETEKLSQSGLGDDQVLPHVSAQSVASRVCTTQAVA